MQGQLGPHLRPLASICPTNATVLDLTAVVGHAATIGDGVDALMSASRQHMRAEIGALSQQVAEPWPWRQLDSNLKLRRELGSAIESLHTAAVAPYWTEVRNVLQAERAYQTHVMAQAGIDTLLANLCPPLIRWQPPLLLINSGTGTDVEAQLWGNGLTIVPSAFRGPYPNLQIDLAQPDRQRKLIYPAVRDFGTARLLWAEADDRTALTSLLGRIRSAALTFLGTSLLNGPVAL